MKSKRMLSGESSAEREGERKRKRESLQNGTFTCMTSHQPVNPVSLCPYRSGGGLLVVSGKSEEQLPFTLVFWLQAGCCILTQLGLVGSGPLIQRGKGTPGHLQTPSNHVLPLNVPLTSPDAFHLLSSIHSAPKRICYC